MNRLTVRIVEGRRLALCYADGEPLPCQRDVLFIHHLREEAPTVTVTFVVDGDKIKMVD